MAISSPNSELALPLRANVLASFFRMAPFGLSVLDRDLHYVYVNEVIAAINNRSVEEHIGRPISDIRPTISAEEERAYRKVLATGEQVVGVETTGFPPGEPDALRYWNLNCYPIKAETGEILGVVISVRDITRQKQKELELNERLRFELLLSHLSTTFVNLAAKEVDTKIFDALKSIVEFLQFDRGAIAQFTSDPNQLVRTHHYSLPGTPSPPDESVMAGQLPRWVKSIRSGISYFSNPDELPEASWREKKFCEIYGFKSIISIPLVVGGAILGAIVFSSSQSERKWPEDIIRRLRLVGEMFASALERKRADEKLEKAFLEINALKDRLEAENLYLRDEIKVIHQHEEIIGQSPAIHKVFTQLEQVAGTNSTVLLLGETGTGKELLARAIHNMSSRKGKTMVKVNCAALPSTLIESELFGREKGAYTGALTRQIGRFEAADGSTIFLDEIGELPLELQAKLLRVLQEGQFERLGSNQTIRTDIRVIAATNRDLAQAVKEGKFREDLYYRLNVFPIAVPALRERPQDIPLLIWSFVKEFGEKMGKTIEQIPKSTMEACQCYFWPGNVRELRNVVERAMIMCKGPALRLDLPSPGGVSASPAVTLEEMERQFITKVLESTSWRVRGAGGAAEILALKPTTLDSKMQKLGIRRLK